ncbi:EAL domain-containing protein [Rhodoblastus acidophilus]|uniref:EAL domain-containing protein n=1 Tax=Rhodoblastus acidophilus TaxID=1074 RepID=UPI002484872E|nr:EAL domain-containing protein [Rhodoblastus acidophilus]
MNWPGRLLSLKDLGVGIAVDDFGAGSSALSYLQTFPFDKVTIRPQFDLRPRPLRQEQRHHESRSQPVRRAGHAVVAEGVQTEGPFAALQREGCREAQGGLFSPTGRETNLVGRGGVSPATAHHIFVRPAPLGRERRFPNRGAAAMRTRWMHGRKARNFRANVASNPGRGGECVCGATWPGHSFSAP